MAKFTEMEHVQHFETLCQQLAILSDFSLDNITYNALILIWDKGASFGITPFQSNFIDYVEANIPVKDVTKINRVIKIGTTLHKFQNDKGIDIFLPCVLYYQPTTYVRLFSPQTYHQMHIGHYRLSGDSMEIFCKGNIIVIPI